MDSKYYFKGALRCPKSPPFYGHEELDNPKIGGIYPTGDCGKKTSPFMDTQN